MQKKIPLRTCLVTKEKLSKKELIRIVKTPDGRVVIDEAGKINGHGAYLKKDSLVFDKAKKTKILEKALNVIIPEDVFVKLYELVR